MNSSLSPVAGTFVIILGLLFAFLFIAWCCKQCSQSKRTIVPLICPQDSLYHQRYMTAIDVQTGLPVIIQTVSRNSRNLVRVTSVTNSGRHSINSRQNTTTYGSITPNVPSNVAIIARTPPPPYSEVYAQPRSAQP